MSAMLPSGKPLFPPTAWTLVRRLQNTTTPQSADQALDSLCRVYWEPVRKFFGALGCPDAETADVTQEFFASFLRTRGFDKADPSIAMLRTFLKHSATRFLSNYRRRRFAQRRGSGHSPLPLDEVAEIPADDYSRAADLYDLEWAKNLLDRALTSTEQDYIARGKGALFSAVKTGLLHSGEMERTPVIARDLGITEGLVRLALHRARQRLAETLKSEVAATLEDGADIHAELRYLMGIISRNL